ncbi:MAG: MaoC/PaaZ C-terminal domain-containing protein [Sinimarinibacterium sp.]|jgi:acyl dehydratase
MSTLQPGQALPELVLPAISRHTLALYCGGSGDHNPLHVDSDFARSAGLDDVIAHGMLVMAYLARLLTNVFHPEHLRAWRVRFLEMTHVGDVITCQAVVRARCADTIELDITARRQDGTLVAAGEATLQIGGV